ncbi:TetR/AcrR family transcriptional regulator [Azorhizobium oxalatiphilum]|uniref:TetR/AcrR family transcriptional regulator n=1 Tax=Azorhizobium oxalatiphilum TaxID=980631 RepID=UPI00166A1C1A|nr:TetR/AcrR family transcriptional regulator [Azorhizobium oxalatiphilum]
MNKTPVVKLPAAKAATAAVAKPAKAAPGRATAAKSKTGKSAAAPAPTSQSARTSRTKQLILDAAYAAFVAHGFDGANIEAISQAAGVNKTLVYRHFSNKDELFTVVLENAYLKMRAAEKELALDSCQPTDAIVKMIRFTWTYYDTNPDFLSLVATENLCGGRHLGTSARFPAHASQLMQTVEATIGRGMADGSFRKDVNPVQLWVSIAAMCWFYVANRHTLSATFGAEMLTPAHKKERLEHIIDMVLRDLTGEPAPRPAVVQRSRRRRREFA